MTSVTADVAPSRPATSRHRWFVGARPADPVAFPVSHLTALRCERVES
jgi:hypothetical protein